MRVLIVSDYSPTEVHGIALHVRNLVLELRRLGHDVAAFTCKSGRTLERQGYECDHLDVYRSMGLCVTNYWNRGNQICLAPGCNLLSSMRSWKPDIIHVFFPTAIAWVIFAWARVLGVPTYASHHVDMVHYVDAYVRCRSLRNFADYLYTFGARIPAMACSDANVAPSLASMRKECLFLDSYWASSYGGVKAVCMLQQESSSDARARPMITNSSAQSTTSSPRRIGGGNKAKAVVKEKKNKLPDDADSQGVPVVNNGSSTGRGVSLVVAPVDSAPEKSEDTQVEVPSSPQSIMNRKIGSFGEPTATCGSFISALCESWVRSLSGNCIQKRMFVRGGRRAVYTQRDYMVIPTAVPSIFTTGGSSSSTAGVVSKSDASRRRDAKNGAFSSSADVVPNGDRTRNMSRTISPGRAGVPADGQSPRRAAPASRPPPASRMSRALSSVMSPSKRDDSQSRILEDTPTVHVASSSPTNVVSSSSNHLPTPSAVKNGVVPPLSTEEARVRLRRALGSDIKQERKIVLMVNRLAPEKHVELAIDVISNFPEEYHLVICGDGPSRIQLEGQAIELAARRAEACSSSRTSTNNTTSSSHELELKSVLRTQLTEGTKRMRAFLENQPFVDVADEERLHKDEEDAINKDVVEQAPTTNKSREQDSTDETGTTSASGGEGTTGVSLSVSTAKSRAELNFWRKMGTNPCSGRTKSSGEQPPSNNVETTKQSRKILSPAQAKAAQKDNRGSTSSTNLPTATSTSAAVASSSPSRRGYAYSRSTSTAKQVVALNVTFCGAVPNELLPILFYSGSDLFLTCSESETFGITLLEALGCDLLPVMPSTSPVFREFYGDVLGDYMFADRQGLHDILASHHRQTTTAHISSRPGRRGPGAGTSSVNETRTASLTRTLSPPRNNTNTTRSTPSTTASSAATSAKGRRITQEDHDRNIGSTVSTSTCVPPLSASFSASVSRSKATSASSKEFVRELRRKLEGKVFFCWRTSAEETVRQYEKVIGHTQRVGAQKKLEAPPGLY
ncbi:unnamed protein product [Amoebophrya sp. A25]|nr:unnamed protein product [Amoebophrya sp. A25]|eukprot:GSA25T00020037001.1